MMLVVGQKVLVFTFDFARIMITEKESNRKVPTEFTFSYAKCCLYHSACQIGSPAKFYTFDEMKLTYIWPRYQLPLLLLQFLYCLLYGIILLAVTNIEIMIALYYYTTHSNDRNIVIFPTQ